MFQLRVARLGAARRRLDQRPRATLARSAKVPALPDSQRASLSAGLRWIAAIVAVIPLGATIMLETNGKELADGRRRRTRALITDSLFAYVRHPIYAPAF
jgi:protein-S-isoprenylcysteine O-methyltransferase Ste14